MNSLYASSTTTAGAGRPSAAASASMPVEQRARSRRRARRGPVGLFGLQIQTSVASRAARADRREVHGPAVVAAEARDGDHAAAALLGVDPVHRVGRDRDRPRPRRRAGTPSCTCRGSRPRPAPGTSSSVATPYASAAASTRLAVVAGRVLGEGRLEPARGEQPGEQRGRRGRGVEVEPQRPARPGCRSARRRPRPSPPSCTRRGRSATRRANGLGLIGRARSVGGGPRSGPRRRRGGRAGPRPRRACGWSGGAWPGPRA